MLDPDTNSSLYDSNNYMDGLHLDQLLGDLLMISACNIPWNEYLLHIFIRYITHIKSPQIVYIVNNLIQMGKDFRVVTLYGFEDEFAISRL